MKKQILKRILSFILIAMMIAPSLTVFVSAATAEALDGQISVYASNGTITTTANSITITHTISGMSLGTSYTFTLTNETSKLATISFDYEFSTFDEYSFNNDNTNRTGSYNASIASGASLTFTGKSTCWSGQTDTLKITNIVFTPAADTSNVTISYDSSLGSVTAGGSTVTNGATVEGVSLESGVALVATPNSGTTFLGWIDASTNAILSTAASYTLTPASDMTVQAVFVNANSKPWFGVGGSTQQTASSGLLGMSKITYFELSATYLFDDLTAAANAASSGTNKYITLMNSGTLSAGTYTIPAGVTLLIPFDSANSLYTTAALNTGTYTTPTAYRTLTMADGANLIINGAVSLSAMQRYAQGSQQNGGSPTGAVSFIKMQGNSNITVNNGGALYAYGFITGSGTVTANSGATVYEMFQIMDFRGGTQSTDMENGVFPLSQYYVQNIEVPMTLYSGATEYAYTTIYMSSADFGSAVAFIANSDAMFNLTSGYVTKRYDGATDRLIVESYGDMTVSPINMTVGTASINSKDYELGINGNISLTAVSGTITIGQDVALLPGSKITVGAGATCKLSEGVSVYIYDADEWGTFCGPSNAKILPINYAPGKTYTRTEADLVDAEIIVNGTMDASVGYVYTTAGGANIYSTGTGVAKLQAGTETVTYQLVQGTGYTEIPITPAKLKNADGNHITTNTNTFTYTNGKWICATHTPGAAATCITAQTCTVCNVELASTTDHSYDAGVDTTAATCGTAGVKTYTCSVCQGTKTETIPATGVHVAGDAATCTTAQTCTVCGTQLAAALGHTPETVPAVAATCTETGLTEGKKCSVCDTVITAQTEVAAKGHSWGAVEYTWSADNSTCTATRYCANDDTHPETETVNTTKVNTPSTCTAAGADVYTATFENEAFAQQIRTITLDLAGHTAGDAATCTTAQTCTECEHVFVAALGHRMNSVSAKAATCTETGNNAYYTCSTCNKVFKDDQGNTETTVEAETIKALGHNWSEEINYAWSSDYAACEATRTCTRNSDHTESATGTVTFETTAAECGVAGKTVYTATFENSEFAQTQTKEVEIAALTHAWSTVTYTWSDDKSTCTAKRTCSTSGCIEEETGEIAVTTTDATCDVAGTTTYTATFKNAAFAKQTETVTGQALGHNWQVTYEWTNNYTVCTATLTCQNNSAHKEVVTGTVSSATVDATCERAGETVYTGTFDNANCTTQTHKETLTALGHKWGTVTYTWSEDKSTCTASIACERGCTQTENATVNSETTVATCVAAGKTVYTATFTNTAFKAQTAEVAIEKLTHTYGEGVVTAAPTCTGTGVKTFTCTTCPTGTTPHSYTETVPAAGHTEETVQAVPATCTTSGKTAGSKCSVCSIPLTEQEDVPALGHDYESVVTTQPTCTEKGVETFTCKNDSSHTYTEETEATGHSYNSVVTAPTCTERGYTTHTCTKCAEGTDGHSYVDAYVNATGHAWNEGVVTTAPTCTGTGVKTFTCPNCTEGTNGHSYTEDIPATGHTYDEGVETKAATCTEAGIMTFTCNKCAEGTEGHSYTMGIAALGHDMYYQTSKEPTCTEPGASAAGRCFRDGCGYVESAAVIPAKGHSWDAGVITKQATCSGEGTRKYTCTVYGCGATDEQSIEKLPHTEIAVDAVAPTCTAIGLTAGSKCSVCNQPIQAQEEVEALGHTEVVDASVAPTCTETGLTEGKHCSVCDEIIVAQNNVPAIGHSAKKNDSQLASCTLDGWKEHYYCSNCKTYYSDEACSVVIGNTDALAIWKTTDGENGGKIAATGHAWNEGVVTTAPTCTGTGVKTYTCSTCQGTKTEVIQANGHSAETLAAVAPTCTETGLNEGEKCSVCGTVTVLQTEIAALGHNRVVDEAVEATCTATGLTEGYHCSRCDGDTKAQEELPALGHSFTNYVSNGDATCTEDGTKTAKCDRCDETDKVADVGSKKGHSFTNYTSNNDATCTEDGTKTAKCDNCDETNTLTDTESALGHNRVVDEAVEATCTATGLTEGYHCSRCDGDTKAQEELPALGHSFTNYVSNGDATCTEDGTKTAKCDRCDETDKVADVGSKKGHSFTNYTSNNDATCTEDGTKTAKCDSCDETSTLTDTGSALGHDSNITLDAVAATCTATGLTEGKKCSKCGDIQVAQTVVPALGHTEVVDEAVAATCTAAGKTAGKHCSVCEAVLVAQAEVAALGHTEVVDKAVAPTCTTAGKTEGKHCSVCNEVLVAQDEVAALGHTEVIDAAVAATCTTAGKTEGKHCSVCNQTLVAQETVEALGHTEVVDEAVEATCTAAGKTEGKHCSVCNEVLKAQEEIPAVGHTEVVDAAVEATCTTAGKTEGKHCSVCNEVLTAQVDIPAPGHTEVIDAAVAATCSATGLTEGKHCFVCNEVLVAQTEVEKLPHELTHFDAKAPTYTEQGYAAYDTCNNCEYTTFAGFIEALGEPEINNYNDFITNLALLEELAFEYVKSNPTKDPIALVIKYIRTGVDRYNSGSWGIMAGYEDADFAKFVKDTEDQINANGGIDENGTLLAITALKNVNNFTLPNGDYVDLGHMFGAMDITYHNKGSVNHADVSGWAGDLVDLLSTTDRHGVTGTLEEMVADISANYLNKSFPGESDLFTQEDMYGDLDAFYVMETLYATEYSAGTLANILSDYFTEDLDDVQRADFFLKNRLGGVSTRSQVRDAVYQAYTGNKVIATLEGTREFNNTDLSDLRKACCYSFADYICKLAGDYVESTENPYLTVFKTTTSTLAPGITQEIKYATSADGKQMVYYLATGDITRGDVHVYANYNNNDPAAGWAMQRVLDQANAAQEKYGNPESEYYIPNYNVIVSTNGAGFNMSTGEPGGLLVMGGVEYHEINANGFFGILKDGTAVIGTTEEYNTIYKGQVQEGIAAFGSTLVKDGEISITQTSDYYTSRASRTAVGITATGKVVMMVLDGRQEPFSCGGSMIEIAQIMLDAGCVQAVNLDGGGSTTFIARQEGEDELSLVSSPSDGVQRSVSTSLIMVSTAPSSTAFDHARLDSDYDYATIGTSVQLTPVGISATGNEAELPEGYTWAISDERWGTVTQDGVFTGLRNGSVTVNLMLGDVVIGSKTMNIVTPDAVYFTRSTMDAVYGSAVTLPVAALYENKKVAINESDVTFSMNNTAAGTIEGFVFTGEESSGVKVVKITASLASNTEVNGSISVNLYKQGENTFDFDKATDGDRQLAWDRVVSNSTTDDNMTYTVVDTANPMVTSYIFAMDMSEIPIPDQLADLVYMLPGADMENASAWNFLLQLAERVSVLTTVTPVLRFDKNFDVDYSELKILNEYFTLTGTSFDEATNTLTLTLNWIDQTQAIDPTTANPLCIVSGIKLTPKADADWGTNNRLAIQNSGEISYEIYLRANALYSFAQKPENQEIYGLKPFVNPDLPSESGASFGDVYKEFSDSYNLVNVRKSGWMVEDGGYAYYVDGERLTGINLVEGYYYDFGTNGINVGQTKYTGLIINEDKTEYRYAMFGELLKGWYQIEGNYYYFNSSYIAVDGVQTIDGYTYTFENFILIEGATVKDANGVRYYWAGKRLPYGWFTANGKTYCVRESSGYVVTGKAVFQLSNEGLTGYEFTEDGILVGKLGRGLVIYNGKTYYLNDDGIAQSGLILAEDGYYYYFSSSYGCTAVTGRYYVSFDNGLGYKGWQEFDEQGRLLINGELETPDTPVVPDTPDDGEIKNGFYTEDGVIRYYIDGVKQGDLGLVLIDGYLYYINSSSVVVTGRYYVSRFNGYPEYKGWQEFDEQGRLLIDNVPVQPEAPEDPEVKNGFYTEDGVIRYYIDGVRQGDLGLVEIEGSLYYINSSSVVVTGRYYISRHNDLGYRGWQEFDETGKLIVEGEAETPETPEDPEIKNGFYTEDGVIRYYIDNVRQGDLGLIEIDGYLYYVNSSSVVVTGTYYVSRHNDLEYKAWQEFDETGKLTIDGVPVGPEAPILPEMKNGFYTEDGIIRYYIDDVKQGDLGLIEIDGYLYYVNSSSVVVTGRYYVSRHNDLDYRGWQEFDETGKLTVDGIPVASETVETTVDPE